MKTITATLLLLLTSTSLFAQSNSVIVRVAVPQYSGDRASVAGEGDLPFTLSSNLGYGIGFAHSFSPRFSAAFDVMRLNPDVRTTVDGVRLDAGSMTMTPLTAIARIHSRYAYAGAGVAYVTTGDLRSDDLDLTGIGSVSVDNELTYVLNAGLSIPAGKSMHIDFDARWLPMNVDVSSAPGRGSLKFNTLILGAGLGWKF